MNTMDFLIATNKQIKVIIERDGECPPHLLYPTVEEAIRRDLYKNYIIRLLNRRFKAIKYAEYLTKMTFDEIKNLCYEQAFEALKCFKPGKGRFISFWAFFIQRALNHETRKHGAKMRTAEFLHIDDDTELIQLVDDHNTERKAVNRVYLESLLSHLSELERDILIQYNNDFTFVEIGEKYGLSRETVRLKHKRSIEKLKKLGA